MRKRLAKKIFNRQVRQMAYKRGCILIVDSRETAMQLAGAKYPPEWKNTPIVVGKVEQADVMRWSQQQDPERW